MWYACSEACLERISRLLHLAPLDRLVRQRENIRYARHIETTATLNRVSTPTLTRLLYRYRGDAGSTIVVTRSSSAIQISTS